VGDFDYLYDRIGEGVYILTMHPQAIGRGHRLLMLERLVNHIREREGVTFKTMSDVALEFKQRNPLPSR
jgi:peptidoglycan/xylan/chitin deacetylase (PgdA/CDA1 family)